MGANNCLIHFYKSSNSLVTKMGKPKSHSSKAKKLARKKNLTTSSPNYNIEELLEKARDLLDECQFELAEKFCQRALEMSNDHPQALEMSANLLLERGEVEKAQQCLGRAITVQPDQGHTKYLTAAQKLGKLRLASNLFWQTWMGQRLAFLRAWICGCLNTPRIWKKERELKPV